MAIQATDLFKSYSKARDGVAWLPAQAKIRVAGTVVRVALGHDKIASVSLAGDDRGVETVECRCVSDEALLKVTVGSTAVLEGACAGLEDSVTLVLELCELLDVRRPSHRWREAPQGGAEGRAEGRAKAPATAVDAAEFFGRHASRRASSHPPEGEEEVEVTGRIVRCFLSHDKVACAALAADSRGMCVVECRFLSDEVLPRLVVGTSVAVRGACQGLEDSLTLLLERCELPAADAGKSLEPPARVVERSPEVLPVRVTASELFTRCSGADSAEACGASPHRFEVTGTVERSFLRQGVACVSLRADEQGVCTIECRCSSDEVLGGVNRGASATLRGFAAGLDDSVTLVLESCELRHQGDGTSSGKRHPRAPRTDE